MATKKIQNFVKNIGSAQTNKSTPFSKSRNKTDTHEDLFMFENLESDKEDFIDEEGLANLESGNVHHEDNSSACDVNSKTSDDYDIFACDQDCKTSSNNSTTVRSRAGMIGKSVNTALKDAHIAINAMKESMRKKGVRKPSEVTKEPRGGFRRKKAVMAAMLREYQTNINEKSLTCELQKEMDESFECFVNEKHQDNTEIEIVLDNISPLHTLDHNEPQYHIIENKEIEETVEDIAEECIVNNVDLPQQSNLSDPKFFIVIGSFLLIFFLISISKFILGFLCGIIMSIGGLKIYESFFSSTEDMPVSNKKYPHLRELASPVIPCIVDTNFEDEYASAKASFSAWVNAVNSYHPSSYNSTISYSLHISLEGTLLRMRKPKTKISSRAMSNDIKISGVTIVGESTLELLHAKIHLVPYGLVRGRMWSKRYPICVTVKKSADDKCSRPAIITTKFPDTLSSVLPTGEENVYFFARTCREKEEMFRRLMAASLGMPINLTMSDILEKYLSKEMFTNQPIPLKHALDPVENESSDPVNDDTSVTNKRSLSKNIDNIKEPQLVTYVRYMAKFMPDDSLLLKAKSYQIDLNYISCESELLWLNALIGRLAWEVFRGGHWVKVIREKIQRKLKKLHLPYFIDQLAIIDIDLGTELPVIKNVSRPYLDYRGLWVEFDVVYAGGFSMGLETKINLMKLKKTANQQKATGYKKKKCEFSAKYVIEQERNLIENVVTCGNGIDFDNNSSDVSLETKMQIIMSTGGGAVLAEDDDGDGSGALSTDESYASTSDSELTEDKSSGLPQSSPSNKSLLQWVDKIAKSPYFLKAADNKYVVRTMEYVSNTSLQLQVDAQYLNGTMVINIPPPPSDRLWWGFKNSPQINFKARPKVGQTEIQMTKLIEFIEKKLLQEFHRAAVLPNMDDITIPLLFTGNPDRYNQTLF